MAFTVVLKTESEIEAVFAGFATNEEAAAFGKKAVESLEELRADRPHAEPEFDIFEVEDDHEAQLENLLNKERDFYANFNRKGGMMGGKKAQKKS